MATANDLYDKSDKARRGEHRPTAVRDEFEVDKGRIIHSAAFRRLQGKTQVLGVGERDFYRTRLTHSLEVAQLGRGMCVELPTEGFRPNPDLVEAICLAHDIGHPPFGHSGEDYLNEKMKQFGGFGANPQNIRVVTFLEAKFMDVGLDLTRSTLDGLLKYPSLYNKTFPDLKDKSPRADTKFTYCDSTGDVELFKWIKNGVEHHDWNPIEGQIADFADQVAYSVNDFEDTIRAGLLSPVEMLNRADEISVSARKRLEKIATGNARPDHVRDIVAVDAIAALAKDLQKQVIEPTDYRLRKVNLKKWTSDQIKLLKKANIIKRSATEKLARYQFGLFVDLETQARMSVLKETAKLLVFRDPRVTTLEEKGHHIINSLFDKFCETSAGSDKYLLMPIDFQQLIEQKAASRQRLVADFISGMTDRYAYYYYRRLFEPGIGSFYEDV